MSITLDPFVENQFLLNRRRFFAKGATGIGIAALSSLLNEDVSARPVAQRPADRGLPHFAPKAKRVIYLFQSGAPSQMDLFDYKPALDKLDGTELPASVRMGQRLTGMTAFQKSFRVTQAPFGFERCGNSTRI